MPVSGRTRSCPRLCSRSRLNMGQSHFLAAQITSRLHGPRPLSAFLLLAVNSAIHSMHLPGTNGCSHEKECGGLRLPSVSLFQQPFTRKWLVDAHKAFLSFDFWSRPEMKRGEAVGPQRAANSKGLLRTDKKTTHTRYLKPSLFLRQTPRSATHCSGSGHWHCLTGDRSRADDPARRHR